MRPGSALPELDLEGSSSSSSSSADRLPSRELEFDSRVRVEVTLDSGGGGGQAHCDTGEVKYNADFASAIPQLGIRLRALAWVVSTTQGRRPRHPTDRAAVPPKRHHLR